MRPVRLEIENLRSFRTRRIIEFGEPRLFAIVGDTGAGKTSILEAITYALFNRSTWDGREVTALIAKGARSMSVTLTFVVDGDEFTITRITRIGRQPTQRLDCLARGISVSTQPDVERELYKALHFDAETFLHTVLLPQGKHAELLTKKPNQRNKILAEIFHLDAIGDVLEQTKILEAKADTALLGLRRERSDYPADSSAALSSAELQLQHAVVRVSAALASLKAVQELDAQNAKVNAHIVSITERVSRLATPPDAMVTLELIESSETALNIESAECLRDRDDAELARRNAQESIEKLRSDGMDADTLHETERTLDELAIQNREVAAAIEKAAELRAILAQCLATRETASAQLESAERDRASHKNQSAICQTELQSAAESLRQLEMDAASWKQAIGTLTIIETNLAKQLENDKTLRAKLAVASTAKEEALAALSNATIALDIARRTNGAAALAEHLHAGDSCPVCSRTLPTTFSPPASADFSAATSVADAKTVSLQECATLVDRLTTQIESSASLIVTAQQEAANAKVICDALVTKQPLLRDSSRTLEAEIAAQAEAVSILTISAQQSSSAFDDATERHGAATARVALADGEATSVTAQIDDLDLKLKVRLDDLKRLIALLPDSISELISGDNISKCRILLSEWRREALAVAELLSGARNRLNDCNERLGKISQRKTQLVVAPRQLLIGTISSIAASLGLPAPPAEPDESKAWARTVISTAGAEIDKCVTQKASLIRDSELIHESRQAQVKDLGGEPQVAHTEALIAQIRAEADLATVTAALKRAQQIDEKTLALEPAALGLAALKATLGARAFLAYATMQRQQRLLEIASGILSEMVDGRYAFTSDFEILDRSSNEVRATDTLSGGEKFLASLALSLAVVEIAANGGAKIEALFLDEGFDSLDATMLPMAMLELSKRSHAGRTICVITHVLDAAQFVSDTLLVRKTGDGSEVVSIDGPLNEDTAALEGLVSQLSA